MVWATRAARQALDAAPGDPVVGSVAATVLLVGGDTRGAERVWQSLLADHPGDSLALYGLGLIDMARGDLGAARTRIREAAADGDRSACMLAMRYLEILDGGRAEGLVSLPVTYRAAVRAMIGMSELRDGGRSDAVDDVVAALEAMPGDPYAELPAPLMTFTGSAALAFGGGRLPAGHRLDELPRRDASAVSGIVSINLTGAAAGIGFVAYRVDGQSGGISNSPPFRITVDTRRLGDGLHTIEILLYDAQGREIRRETRNIRSVNGRPRTSRAASAAEERLRSETWRTLTLQPGRQPLALAAYRALRAEGDSAHAREYIELAAALAPDTPDVRASYRQEFPWSARQPLWQGGSAEKVVAITFDDGPKRGITEHFVAEMARGHAVATFFVIGRHVTANPDLARLIVDSGMQIGGHSYTHPNLARMPTDQIERELLRTSAAIRRATGREARWFRPPGGHLGPVVQQAAARWGMSAAMWTLNPGMLEYGDSKTLAAFVVQHTHPGAVVLLHNGQRSTLEALPDIIAGLRRRGFQFVTVEELDRRLRRR